MIYGPSYGTRVFGRSFLCDLSPLILGFEAPLKVWNCLGFVEGLIFRGSLICN